MPNWEEVQKMMVQAQTVKEKTEALKCLQTHIPQRMQNSLLATMSKGSNVNAVKLSELHQYASSEELFSRLKDLINGK
jgi:hypothetical protein